MDYFVFKGIDSRTFDIKLNGVPPLQRGKKRVQQITIPGRAGTLTLSEGDESYEPYIQGLAISVPADQWARVQRWLTGSGSLTLCNDPDRAQDAEVINQLNFQKVSKFIDYYKGQIQFYCQPLKNDIAPARQEVTDSAVIVNMGDVPEKPIITVYGTGNITIATDSGVLQVAEVNGGCIIDCGAYEITNLEKTELLTGKSTGDFPALPVGRSVVTVSGADHVSIERRQRYL